MLGYKLGFHKVPKWDESYRDWLYFGPNASPEPPIDPNEMYLDALQQITNKLERVRAR